MIDLNHKSKKPEQEKETPVGVIILSLLPFAVLFYVVITASFLHGI